MKTSNFIKQSLGLEDDSPQVEINFNVDTDDNGAPLSPVTESGEETVEAAKVDAIESQVEAKKAESEQDELEEAQEALESLKSVVEKASAVGGLNEINMEMFRIAMGVITGDKFLAATITTESMFESPLTRQVNALNIVNASMEAIETVSMEGLGDMWSKVKNAILKFFKVESVLLKRAEAFLKLADTRENEHSESKTIPVNVKRGLSAKNLNHTEYKEGKEIVVQAERMVKFFESITPLSFNGGGVDEEKLKTLLDNIFTLDDKEYETVRGKHGMHKEYKFFNVIVEKSSYIEIEQDSANKSLDSLPVLTTDEVKTVLDSVIRTIKTEGTINQVIDELDHYVAEAESKNEHLKSTSLDFTISGLFSLLKLRYALLDELVNYCGMCIQDRGVD